jgi:hypothetical protein
LQDLVQLPAKFSFTKNKASHVTLIFKFHYQKESFRQFGKERGTGEYAKFTGDFFEWHGADIHPDWRPIACAVADHEGMVPELHRGIDLDRTLMPTVNDNKHCRESDNWKGRTLASPAPPILIVDKKPLKSEEELNRNRIDRCLAGLEGGY